ncbi:MAG: TetR/AcrR family transcriptional regulator [Lachnospiraceae bacterium]|nr:TetR/AcrR family transcriptional regulator [Lachnospiraceae bacterium]
MPKDKTATNKRLQECMRREFLEKGFEKASLNHIAKQAGITPAGVYRHYASKEAMFESLVAAVAEEFYCICEEQMRKIDTDVIREHVGNGYSTFEEGWIDYIYRHFDEFKLLIVCSKGTKYEGFLDTLVTMEEKSSAHLIQLLKREGFVKKSFTEEQIHITATMYITGLYEIIRHDMPKEKAIECIRFIYEFYDGAWKSALEMR